MSYLEWETAATVSVSHIYSLKWTQNFLPMLISFRKEFCAQDINLRNLWFFKD